MKTVLLVLVGLLLACATPPLIRLPATDEAMACSRQCMFLSQGCHSSVISTYAVTGGNQWAVYAARNQCNEQHRQCLWTCPGACEQHGAACYDALGRNMLQGG